ncbi:MAG: 50S ribosomal protein L21 [Candidatus Omnitrophica bacterium]|nr:50S ribosomal protein L21 [Candidatus Omnitrophota bacterium]
MYAVVETGGKQYRIEKGQEFEVELLEGAESSSVTLSNVLLVADGENVAIGHPYLEGGQVQCTLLAQTKGEKVVNYRYNRRKKFDRKVGHRQKLTRLRVEEILTGGKNGT